MRSQLLLLTRCLLHTCNSHQIEGPPPGHNTITGQPLVAVWAA